MLVVGSPAGNVPRAPSTDSGCRKRGKIAGKEAASRKVNWNAEKVAKRRVTSGELH